MFEESFSETINVAQLGQVGSGGSTTQLSTDFVFELLGLLPVTNTMLTAACVTVLLILVAVLVRLTLNVRPSPAQNAAELLVESWLKSRKPPAAGAHDASSRWSEPHSCLFCPPTGLARCP